MATRTRSTRTRATGAKRSSRASDGPTEERFSRDFSDTEYRESNVYDGALPTKGLYRFELVAAGPYTKQGEDEPSSVRWLFRAMEGEENKHGESVAGWPTAKYTGEKGKFIEQKILVAAGLMKPDDEDFDMSWADIVKKAKPVRALVTMERYIPDDPDQDAEWRPQLGRDFLPDDGGASTAAKAKKRAEQAEDDEEDDEPPPRSARGRGKPEPEPEPEGDEDLPTDEELDDFADELDDMELSEVKDQAKLYGVPVKRGAKKEDLIEAIVNKAAEEGFAEEDEGEEPEEDEEPEEEEAKPARGRARTTSRSRGKGKGGFSDDPPF